MKPESARQIKDVLEEEANALALVLDGSRTDARIKDAGLPRRVEIAIRREITRLRRLAEEVDNVAVSGPAIAGTLDRPCSARGDA